MIYIKLITYKSKSIFGLRFVSVKLKCDFDFLKVKDAIILEFYKRYVMFVTYF